MNLATGSERVGIKITCTDICHSCRVYMKYGNQEPIVIKLYGT